MRYHKLIAIPEAKLTVGEDTWEIHHMKLPAGEIERANMRTMLFGHRVEPLKFKRPTTWHELLQNGGRWMSDLPIEQFQHRRHLPDMRGHVLVGGLGLGLMVTMLGLSKRVTRITVVEIEQSVLDLVAPHTRSAHPVEYVCADLREFVKAAATREFDSAFMDIWTTDSEGQFHDQTLPLKKAASRIVRGEVACWNEDVMRGQLMQGLSTRLLFLTGVFPEPHPDLGTIDDLCQRSGSKYHDWAVPFWCWLRDARQAKSPWSENPQVQRMAALYVWTFEHFKADRPWNPKWANEVFEHIGQLRAGTYSGTDQRHE
jgi:hypothetical protein